MSLPHFYLENQVLASEVDAEFPLRLSSDDAKHARVLRLAAGEHIAVVDAVPRVGSGVVLLPWALIALLQENHFLSIGLLCTYGAASLSRSLLEPRIVGKQLGLDPLLTLFALYAGFRFLGLPGLLLAPFFAMAIKMLFLKK